MPKIEISENEFKSGRYPQALMRYYEGITDGYRNVRVGNKAGLTQFGVNKAILPPNSGTAMRHWHEHQDEMVIIVSGTATLFDKDGQHELVAGDCAGFKAGDENGHAIINQSDQDVILFEIGTRTDLEIVHYSAHDLICIIDRTKTDSMFTFTDKAGNPIVT